VTKRKATQDTGHARRSSPREAEAKKKHQDELLDEALKLTFPASDPIAVDDGFKAKRKRDRARLTRVNPPASRPQGQ